MAWLYALNPPLYYAAKAAAIYRHIQLRKLEGDPKGDLQDTWHQDMIERVYPL